MKNVAGRVLLFVIAGALAGFLTWLVSDATPLRPTDSVGAMTARETLHYQIIFMVWGAFVAVSLGVADTIVSGRTAEWLKVIAFGIGVGVVAGIVGGAFDMAFFGRLYAEHARTPFDFLRNVFARALGWAFIGALAGTAPGWRKMSMRVGRNGLIGGLIGGILGGGTFEVVPYLMPGINPGPVSRFFGFVITGAMIGLFVALVQELLKEAWIRVVVGRNEGKEILIEKAETRIGRAELSDVPLFGDPQIARTHAVIASVGNGRWMLRDTGESPLGVLVNGQRITGEKEIRSGDQIQTGSRMLIFYERLTRNRTAPLPKDVAAPVRTAMNGTGGGGLPSLADLPQATGQSHFPSGGAVLAQEARSTTIIGGTGRQPAFVATGGPYTGTRFALRNGATIGRDANADIPLPADPKASRLHARFIADGAGVGFAIEDGGSTNGTFVNGQKITARQTLVSGDTVVIGTTSLRFE